MKFKINLTINYIVEFLKETHQLSPTNKKYNLE